MTYSDDFLAWLKKDECRLHMSPLDAQYAAWQAAGRAALERALEAVKNEHLCDPTDSADDIAYEQAIIDCEYAIRDLIEQDTQSGEKQK